MQRNAPEEEEEEEEDNNNNKKIKFSINDHLDILTEILKRLDGSSLCAAACVCRLWSALARNDDYSLWEHLCFRHLSSPPPPSLRPVVVALGGYKRLYMLCLRPLLIRLNRSDLVHRRRLWTLQDQVQLSLSLFCVDCYEKSSNGFLAGDAAPSLRFLCKPVNV